MINLLPPSHKKQIKAGRVNVLLVRYLAMLAAAVGVLSVLIGTSYIVLNATQQNAIAKVADNEKKVADFQAIRDKGELFRSDLATAKAILDNEVAYSKLIYRIADAVPPNVILDSLELDKATLGSKATMSASARTYADAIALKDTFGRDSQLFSDVSFQTISRAEGDGGAYPIKVNLGVTVNKEALR
jgi:hypothetical protein